MYNPASWLTLKSVPGIGNLRFRKLVAAFGSPDAVLSASEAALSSVSGISPDIASRIRSGGNRKWAEQEAETAEQEGIRLLCLGTPAYPALLSEIFDPPPVVYVKGELPQDAVAVGIVGSRRATRYGQETAHGIAGELATSGALVVSGLAIGIDTAAHKGALDANGSTIAVLGCGLHHCYPERNRSLAGLIAQRGALVSELSLDTPPEARQFPARNRLISGLSVGVAVIEAAEKSGSLITARMALEQGREVYALPGSVRSKTSQGTHHLLKQGAKLIVSAADILEDLPFSPSAASPFHSEPNFKDSEKSLDPTEITVLKALDPYPVHIDDIGRRIGLESCRLSALLLRLELAGRVQQYPGKYFAKAEEAP